MLGVLRDKDVAGICQALAPLARRLIAVPVRSERALEPAGLLEVAATAASGVELHAAASVAEGLAQARTFLPDRVLVTGSLFLIGEVLEGLAGGGDGVRSAQ